jgi:hypothetical protein
MWVRYTIMKSVSQWHYLSKLNCRTILSAKSLLYTLAFFICVGCATPPQPFYTQARSYEKTFSGSAEKRRHTYILQFDENGRLINFLTLFQAVHDIQNSINNPKGDGPLNKIVVMSYGWSHDVNTGELDYYGLLNDYDNYIATNYSSEIERQAADSQTAVFCVSWNSTTAGPGQALGDLLPESSLSDAITLPISTITFPFSVWAKSAIADKIGYQDLKRSLNYIYENGYKGSKYKPDIYLVGHSFGCRILSGMIRSQPPKKLLSLGLLMKSIKTDSKAMQYMGHIKGGIFIEPALTEADLPEKTDFPLLVLQSRHDHLNSLLFPIASVPFSPYISSQYEPNINNWMFRSNAAPSAGDYYVKEPLKALGGVLDVLAFSALNWPWSYIRGQYSELSDPNNWNWRTNYITDTLGQLPAVDIGIREILKNESYHKGVFNLGKWNESVARISSQPNRPLGSLVVTNSGTISLSVSRGVQFINAEKVISRSVYSSKIDLDVPFKTAPVTRARNGLVGWLDPIGSHDDYRQHKDSQNTQVFSLIHLMLTGALIYRN